MFEHLRKVLQEIDPELLPKLCEIAAEILNGSAPPEKFAQFVLSLPEDVKTKIEAASKEDGPVDVSSLLGEAPAPVKAAIDRQADRYRNSVLGSISLWTSQNGDPGMPTDAIHEIGRSCGVPLLIVQATIDKLKIEGYIVSDYMRCADTECEKLHEIQILTSKGLEQAQKSERKLKNQDMVQKDPTKDKPDLKKKIDKLGDDFLDSFKCFLDFGLCSAVFAAGIGIFVRLFYKNQQNVETSQD